MKKSILPIIFVFLTIYLLAGCCSQKETSDLKKIQGTIIIVGNEPFTQPALRTAEDKIYAIECKKEERKTLFDNQGEEVIIYYDVITTSPNGKAVNMVKFEELSEDN